MNPDPLELDNSHALALLKLLHKADGAGDGQELCRLYFVDVDVLATYVDGRNSDIAREWSSLFSLTSRLAEARERPVSDGARELANAIARSISSFLLGRFRGRCNMQRQRLWLTLEHSRELDSVIHAILRSQAEPVGEWQRALYQQYLSIVDALEDSPREVSARLEEIFVTLRENAPVGKVARANEVRRALTSTIQQTPIFPPSDLRSAFLMRCDTPAFEKRTRVVASLALEKSLTRIQGLQNPALWPAAETLHRLMMDQHSPSMKVSDYIDAALRSDEVRRRLPSDEAYQDTWIRRVGHSAAVHASDIYAIGRLITLAESLRRDQPLKAPYLWRVSLISGSARLRDWLKELQDDGVGIDVEIVHPLSAMRFDEFLRPIDLGGDDTPGVEYAMTFLRDPTKAAAGLDASQFFESLRRLLIRASAGFALRQDRSLRNLQRAIAAEPGNHQLIVQAISNAVTSEFIETYQQMVPIEAPGRHRLPAINLPWVHLPLPDRTPSPAETIVHRLHAHISRRESTDPAGSEKDEIEVVNKSDPTGYSACVCAALGYLAMDRDHLLSAEMTANTAARTAELGQSFTTLASYIPEGNEALYLSAFISRMRVNPKLEHRRAAFEWRDSHRGAMKRAEERSEIWRRSYPKLAEKTDPESGLSAESGIRMRHAIEETGRDVYCMLIDLLEPAASRLWSGEADELIRRLRSVLSELELARPVRASELKSGGERGFIGAQLSAITIQFWICEHIRAEVATASGKLPDELESLIEHLLKVVPPNDSPLCRRLGVIFELHRHRLAPTRANPHGPKYSRFASIDEVRVPFLERLESLSRGSPFSLALPSRTITDE